MLRRVVRWKLTDVSNVIPASIIINIDLMMEALNTFEERQNFTRWNEATSQKTVICIVVDVGPSNLLSLRKITHRWTLI